jgi:hypothetical protein
MTRLRKISATLLAIIALTILIPAMTYPAPGTETEAVAGSVNAFAIDLYKQIRKPAENLIFSPYSISMCLAMAYAGARGKTESQMAKALAFHLGTAKDREGAGGPQYAGSVCWGGEKSRNKRRECSLGRAILPAAKGICGIRSDQFSGRAT